MLEGVGVLTIRGGGLLPSPCQENLRRTPNPNPKPECRVPRKRPGSKCCELIVSSATEQKANLGRTKSPVVFFKPPGLRVKGLGLNGLGFRV